MNANTEKTLEKFKYDVKILDWCALSMTVVLIMFFASNELLGDLASVVVAVVSILLLSFFGHRIHKCANALKRVRMWNRGLVMEKGFVDSIEGTMLVKWVVKLDVIWI